MRSIPSEVVGSFFWYLINSRPLRFSVLFCDQVFAAGGAEQKGSRPHSRFQFVLLPSSRAEADERIEGLDHVVSYCAELSLAPFYANTRVLYMRRLEITCEESTINISEFCDRFDWVYVNRRESEHCTRTHMHIQYC